MALKYDREDDEIYANLGEAYEKKGLYSEALKAYTSAYALNPESEKAAQKIPKLKIKLLQEKAQK
jgi:cytochrome c-type biogenesis protein CcmH/NrfG